MSAAGGWSGVNPGIDGWVDHGISSCNRSKFVLEAVRRELARRREELRRSLGSPHPEGEALADAGIGEWAARLPVEADDLVDVKAARKVEWVAGEGWVEGGG